MSEKIKNIISSLPALIIIPYIIGFISVNLYFHYLGFSVSEAINLNYLIVGFFNLTIILVPIVSIISCIIIKSQLTQEKEWGLTLFTYYNLFCFGLAFFELNVFFDCYDFIKFTAVILILIIIQSAVFLNSQYSKVLLIFSNLLLIGMVTFSYITSVDYINSFLVSQILNWGLGFAMLMLILMNPHYLKNKIFWFVLIVSTMVSGSSIIYSGVEFIPHLKINIGGLKPSIGQIYLKDDCKLPSKDSTDIQFKINNHAPINIVYESDMKMVVEDSNEIIEIDADCIQAIKKQRK
jgi:hypothetical protein